MFKWFKKMGAAVSEAATRFAERHLTGHVKLGPVTLYGANAMNFAVQAWVAPLGVFVVYQPPVRGRLWKLYASPNATPWAAVLGAGPGFEFHNQQRVVRRLDILAHAPHPEDEVAGLAYAFGCAPDPRDVRRDHEPKDSEVRA